MSCKRSENALHECYTAEVGDPPKTSQGRRGIIYRWKSSGQEEMVTSTIAKLFPVLKYQARGIDLNPYLSVA